MSRGQSSTIGKFVYYVATGGSAAVVDLVVFVLLTHSGVSNAGAATVSFCTAAVVNYLLTSRFVFGGGASRKGFALFFVVALIGLAINVGVTVLGVSLGLPPVVAKLTGTGVAFLVNFPLNLFIVFRRRST